MSAFDLRVCARAPKGLPSRSSRAFALAAALALLVPGALLAATDESPRPIMGEDYIRNAQPAANATRGEDSPPFESRNYLDINSLLDGASRAWAGAEALRIVAVHPEVELARDVVAYTGSPELAAAGMENGRIKLFGQGNCTEFTLPQGHPAFALALSAEGGVLAAWAQGLHELVLFDRNAPGCPAVRMSAPMQGAATLSLSRSGALLAAQDEAGDLWAGARGSVLHRLAKLGAAPAALGFSENEALLFVVDAQGGGGIFVPATGRMLRSFTIPGGPFLRGAFAHNEARLWTRSGKLVRWDLVHERPVEDALPGILSEEQPGARSASGWLELRGDTLYAVSAALAWKPEPVYERPALALAHSRRERCLRLADVDGEVRYFDAANGKERVQCFASDWTVLEIGQDGLATLGNARFQLFDAVADGPSGRLYCRSLPGEAFVLWWGQRPAQAEDPAVRDNASQPTLPLRLGVLESSPVRRIRLAP